MTPQLFEVPPIISGTGKATNFNFCTHILSIDPNKSLLQISGKVAGCVVRTLKTFQGTHILDASRGVLCASSAVLFSVVHRCRDHLLTLLPRSSWSKMPKFVAEISMLHCFWRSSTEIPI